MDMFAQLGFSYSKEGINLEVFVQKTTSLNTHRFRWFTEYLIN